ncbi:MAG: hypothetical protein SVK08_01455 [Halobacteriota archaeon]|nr:hypothetical protein [Halobacteriota archaeon]
MRIKHLLLIFSILLFTSCMGRIAQLETAGLNIDSDSNDATDIQYGGTNATTASGARSNLDVASEVTYENLNTNGDIDTDLSDGGTASTIPSSAAVASELGTKVEITDPDADAFSGWDDTAGEPDVILPDDSTVEIYDDSGTLKVRVKSGGITGAELLSNIALPSAATATTPAEDDNDTSIATTAYVQTEISGLGGGATRDSLGLDTDDSPQFAGINVGNASDTTVTRSAAGVVAVEGTDLVRASSDINNAGVIQNDSVQADDIDDFYAYELIPISWFVDGTTSPAALDDASTRSPWKYRDFAGDTGDEDVDCVWQIPDDADLTGGVWFRVHYLITNATGPSSEGTAFALQGASIGAGDASNPTLGTAAVVTDTGLTESQWDYRVTGWSSAVTLTNAAAGEMAELNFYRDQDNASDDYAQDVGVAFVEIRFVRDPE